MVEKAPEQKQGWLVSFAASRGQQALLLAVGAGLVAVYAWMAAEMTAQPVAVYHAGIDSFLVQAGIAFALYALAVALAIRAVHSPLVEPASRTLSEDQARTRRRLFGVVTLAVLTVAMRLVLVGAPPRLSDDVYRYVWEGRAQHAGVNPYRHAPDAPELAPLRETFAEEATPAQLDEHGAWKAYPDGLGGVHEGSVYDRINHPSVPAVYQPTAQLVFAATAGIAPTVTAMKLALVLADLVFVLCCVGLCHTWFKNGLLGLLVAWNPLLVIEVAGSGHLDALPLALIALSLLAAEHGHGRSAVVACCLAGATKFLPFLFLPVLLARTRWRHTSLALLVILALYAPYLWGDPALTELAGAAGRGDLGGAVDAVRSLGVFSAMQYYAGRAMFNALPLELASRLLDGTGLPGVLGVSSVWLARSVGAAALLGVIGVAVVGRWSAARAALWLTAIGLFLSPTFYPWYALWLLPYVLMRFRPAWMFFTGAVLLSYLNLAHFHQTGVWEAPLVARIIEFAPLLVALPIPIPALWRPPAPLPADVADEPASTDAPAATATDEA